MKMFAQRWPIRIPLGGNAYVYHSSGVKITEKGIENWSSRKELVIVYLRVAKPGKIRFAIEEVLDMKGRSELEFSINGAARRYIFDENQKNDSFIGEWELKDTGYVALKIRGLSKSTAYFPCLSVLKAEGSSVDKHASYVKNNEGNYFYWGRRGPSVHLSYTIPEKTEVEWFYNEITVPKGNDVIGSYFMANGFAEGYFGIQVNSRSERRILYSVWSPFQTDNPRDVPEDKRIVMLRKGKNVYTGEFGNEGSGGQSFLKFDWKAEHTYRFLLRAQLSANNHTTYTAYFFAPELNTWQLIASFSRPQTQTYLKRLHSFLENFLPEYGDQSRTVNFGNQWIRTTDGRWRELNEARFTTDNTGYLNYRKDYAGGVYSESFYLRNCGFFNDYSLVKSVFTRELSRRSPKIDFNELP